MNPRIAATWHYCFDLTLEILLSDHRFLLGNAAQNEPLLDGHIYFLADYDDFRAAGNIVPDLKWSPRPQVRALTRVFLKQLCLQCAAEAVAGGANEIDWRFSFPTAFSRADEEQYRSICRRVVTDCGNETGRSVRNVSFELESIVAPKFFEQILQSKPASGAFATGAVCIDIGGETSDISIWRPSRQSKPYWQTSVRFAGRHIFLDRLMQSPEIMKDFDEESLEGSSEHFYAQADALIKTRGQKWLDNLEIKSGEPQIKSFVQLVATGVAGLLFYVGLVLRYLSTEREFEPSMPSVYIGGNGSRMLHWLAYGKYKPDSTIKTLLKQVILDASGFADKEPFDVEISTFPKHEAAYGLVADGAKLEWDDQDRSGILAGEAFIEKEKYYEWTEIVSAERVANGLRTTQELEQIENFVRSFNKQTGWDQALEGTLELDADDKNFVFQRLQTQLNDFRGAKVEEIHVEPLFILALKLLLERKMPSDVRKSSIESA